MDWARLLRAAHGIKKEQKGPLHKNLLGPKFMQNVRYSPLALSDLRYFSLFWALLATNSMDPDRVNQYCNELIRTYDMHTQLFLQQPGGPTGRTKA